MRVHPKAWFAIGLLLLGVGYLALRPLPPPRPSTDYVDTGPEPPGLETKPLHRLRSEEVVDGQRFWLVNLIAGPVESRCHLEQAQNAQADPPMPRDLVLPPRAEVELTTLRAVAAGDSSAQIECSAIVGDPRASAPGGITYAVPFYPDTAYVLAQGFDGAFSHHDAQARYALDLGVPEGTPVLAARAGVVMQVEDDFHGHGVDLERYGDRANFIRVLHDDGSMALYAHLAPGTAFVRPGDRVRLGALLARSGNTGFSTGPHLHFAVQRNTGMKLVSIPFLMTGVDLSAR